VRGRGPSGGDDAAGGIAAGRARAPIGGPMVPAAPARPWAAPTRR